MAWIYCLREKGPVILVARTAHHTQTLIASCFDISWINMVNLLFWQFTYPLIWNQVSQSNRTILKSGLSPYSPLWYQFTKFWFASRSYSQSSCSTVVSCGCNTNVSFARSFIFLNANCCSKNLHLFLNHDTTYYTFCISCALRLLVDHTTCSERASDKSINTV